jgi:glycosyltransferase involved in cell wall biosynthesis
MESPIATVLMPVYNAAPFLHQSIESILSQTYTNFVFLIIDDGSSDKSVEIISSYRDPRITLLSNGKNLGLIETLNKGVDFTKTKYSIRQDADDYSHPERIYRLVDYMEEHPQYTICSSNYQNFGDNQQVVTKPREHDSIKIMSLSRCPLAHCASIIRVDDFKKNSLYYRSEFLHAEDYDMLARACHKVHLYNIQEVLYYYRCHESQVSRLHLSIQRKQEDIIRENYLLQSLDLKLPPEDFLVYKKLMIPLERSIRNFELKRIISIGSILLSTNQVKKSFNQDILTGFIKLNLSRIFYIRNNYHPALLFILVKAYRTFGIFLASRKFTVFFLRCMLFYHRGKTID